jgi:zinc transport system substrate-binding protein
VTRLPPAWPGLAGFPGFPKLASLALGASMLAACSGSAPEPAPGPIVVVTIQPLASLVRDVVGAAGTVRALLPPGASPHTFDPLPRDVAELEGARLLVRVGKGLDDWSERLLAGVGAPPRVLTLLDLAEIRPLDWPIDEDSAEHDGHHTNGAQDPHAWLDPIRMRDAFLPALVNALAEVDPEGATGYRARAATVAETLTRADARIRSLLAPAASRGFIAYHDSWRYFAERYDLEQVASIEAYAGDEPTAAELADLINVARSRDVRAVIMEPQLGERIARSIATDLRARIEMADPLGDPTDAARDTYAKAMEFNGAAFARALGGVAP